MIPHRNNGTDLLNRFQNRAYKPTDFFWREKMPPTAKHPTASAIDPDYLRRLRAALFDASGAWFILLTPAFPLTLTLRYRQAGTRMYSRTLR